MKPYSISRSTVRSLKSHAGDRAIADRRADVGRRRLDSRASPPDGHAGDGGRFAARPHDLEPIEVDADTGRIDQDSVCILVGDGQVAGEAEAPGRAATDRDGETGSVAGETSTLRGAGLVDLEHAFAG